MNVMATETRDAARIHDASHKVVTLHPILVRGPVGKVHKRGLTQLVLFEPPVVLKI